MAHVLKKKKKADTMISMICLYVELAGIKPISDIDYVVYDVIYTDIQCSMKYLVA